MNNPSANIKSSSSAEVTFPLRGAGCVLCSPALSSQAALPAHTAPGRRAPTDRTCAPSQGSAASPHPSATMPLYFLLSARRRLFRLSLIILAPAAEDGKLQSAAQKCCTSAARGGGSHPWFDEVECESGQPASSDNF